MALDMSDWKRRRFSVTDELRLDPKNVRLGLSLTSDPPQGDIIQDLFETEGVLSIVESILKAGFFTHEIPVVIEESGQWIVVEGNRRAAAIKAILNPYLVPGYQSRVASLAQAYPPPASLKAIECMIAPSRSDANQLIATLHTSNPRKPWGPLRQAEFFAAQVTNGKSVEALIAEYPGIKVAEFIQRHEMHKLLQSADYQNGELASYAGRKNFPISTFERLYTNPDFLTLTQLSVDSSTGKVTLSGDKSEFDRMAEKIVGDIKAKRINTRTLNAPDEKTYKAYMKQLAPLAVSSSTTPIAVSSIPKPATRPKQPGKNPPLDISGLYAPTKFPAIGRILNEMSTLNYSNYPNATFDLLRTFIEKSIKAYAAGKNAVIPPLRQGGFVQLDAALQWLEADIRQSGHQNRGLVQAVSRLRSNKNFNQGGFNTSKEFLDAANHNHQIFVTDKEVKDLWDAVINILRYALQPQP